MLKTTNTWRRSLLCGGSVAALTIGAAFAPTFAQETQDEAVDTVAPQTADLPPEDETETIVVRGFRASLESAIENKRNASTIIESISAEDIGRLPDISIAEALARLPGISSQRITGQSSAINIRGLSQSLTFATLNGREQVTPNGNRAIEFEQFPSELIAGADVYKSPQANLIEGGLAGTVALKTVRPLDRPGRTATFNIRGIYNDRADEIFDADSTGYRLSASYVDQFANDTIGIAIGYARLEQPDVATRFVGFDYLGASNDFNGDGVNDAASFGFETEEEGGTDTRDGVIGTLQWRPNEIFNWEVDAYYSRFESESFGRGIRVIGPQEINSGNTAIANPVVINNAVVGGLLSRNVGAPTVDDGGFGLTFQGINDNQFDEDELISIGSRASVTLDRWAFAADFTYSSAESFFANEVSTILPIVGFNGNNADGVPQADIPIMGDDFVVDYRLNGTSLPDIAFGNDFTDRTVWQLSRFGAFPFDNEDELIAIQGDTKFDANWGPLASIEVGLRYSEREASQFRESVDFGNDAGFFQFAQNPLTPIVLTPENSSVESFSGDFAAAGFPDFLVVEDPRALVAQQVGPITLDQSQGFTQTDSFTLNEDVLAGYFQFNLDTQVANLPVTGNVGVRVVNTDQSSLSQAAAAEGADTTGIDFTEVLPALNLVFRLTDNDQLRFGASRALSRPPITDLGAGFTFLFNETANRLELSGSGNPTLEPFIANQVDVSYEHYFGGGGIITLAAFYKDLESFVFDNVDENVDFSDILAANLTDEELAQFENAVAELGASTVGAVFGPVNDQGGYIAGVEIAGTYTFDFLPYPFDGFGLTANYAYTDSEVEIPDSISGTDIQLPLPGLSDHVFNSTVFYELNDFAARLGLRYRSEFVSPQVGINQQLPLTDDELVLDFQSSYDIQTPFGEGLTLLFQANNLTDEETATFFGTEAQTGTIQNFGRTFFFGFSYTY